jgi:hypothetical protein
MIGFYTKCDGRLGGVNATINLFDLDSIGIRDDGRRRKRNNQQGRRWTRREEEGGTHNNYFKAQASECDEVTW